MEAVISCVLCLVPIALTLVLNQGNTWKENKCTFQMSKVENRLTDREDHIPGLCMDG
jgi:hypothetical protein